MAEALQVGLLGLGVVGGGVYRALRENTDLFAQRCGHPLSVKRVLVRDPDKARPVAVEPTVLTTDPEAVLGDPEIALVVEVLGGEEPAFTYAKRALEQGKHLVSANKEMLAKHGAELLSLARERGLQVGLEASVGGGIPIIAALRANLAANRITSVAGIVNGTTNYILTEMEEKGRDFALALREAQDLGYAEPDPTNDVEGFDARYKLAILCALAFGGWPRLEDIPCQGITELAPADFVMAREMGFTIKLLASARRSGEGLEAHVRPTLVPMGTMLAGVKGVFNAVRVQGDLVGDVVLYGRGAGPGPTASAILADVIAVATGSAGVGAIASSTALVAAPDQSSGRYYLRLATGTPSVGAAAAERLRQNGVGVAGVYAAADGGAGALLTEPTTQAAVAGAVEALASVPSLTRVSALLPVAD